MTDFCSKTTKPLLTNQILSSLKYPCSTANSLTRKEEENIARVRNCPDVTILSSHFGLCLLSFCLFTFLSFCHFVFLSFCFLLCCLFVILSFCLFDILYFCLFVFLSFCLFVFLSFCLFVWTSWRSNVSRV